VLEFSSKNLALDSTKTLQRFSALYVLSIANAKQDTRTVKRCSNTRLPHLFPYLRALVCYKTPLIPCHMFLGRLYTLVLDVLATVMPFFND
jgi:hypothetical protein